MGSPEYDEIEYDLSHTLTDVEESHNRLLEEAAIDDAVDYALGNDLDLIMEVVSNEDEVHGRIQSLLLVKTDEKFEQLPVSQVLLLARLAYEFSDEVAEKMRRYVKV